MLLNTASKILRSHKQDLADHGVKGLAVFGSVARGDEKKRSDIDILIEFDSKKGLFGFIEVKTYLQKILGCKVDLVTKNALHPALKTKILDEARYVF